MSARTEARTAGSPGEVGNRLLVPWSLTGGQVPEEISGRRYVFDLVSLLGRHCGILVQPGLALWMSQQVKCQDTEAFYYIKSAFLTHCLVLSDCSIMW